MDVLVNKLTVNDLVLGLINEKVYQSIIQDIQTTNEEILIIAKKRVYLKKPVIYKNI